MSNQIPYYIGLDMGTNSVGWAVTDENYKILRGKGKDMWGVRLFDEAQTAADRRINRVARRRRQREVARIGLIKEYFADALHDVDPGFMVRLDESKYWLEDRSDDNQQKFALFNDKAFTDKEYYNEYPTVFHLRKELLESTEAHDVRLVYLAVLNLFKCRGHFLNKSLESDGETMSMVDAYAILVNEAEELGIALPALVDTCTLEEKLSQKGVSRKKIEEDVNDYLGLAKSDKKQRELVKLMCGLSGKMRTIYDEELIDDDNKKLALSFRSSDYEEKMNEVAELIGDENMGLLEAVKQVHDIALLANILSGEQYLSMARVKQYEQHKEDLKQLKDVLKRYDKSAYKKMFRVMGKDNYSAYVGSVNYNEHKERRNGGKGKDSETFLKAITKVLDALPDEAKTDADVISIRNKIVNESFLPKQLNSENGIIPNQVHLRELKKILENASGYLPFLNKVDESGLTVKERIAQLYEFQIPYYVGPLGQEHSGEKGYNVWAKRHLGEEKGRILPWNFEKKIDVEQASQDFIERMVRECTYLSGKKTLPKQSLLYEKFMVLNELNNLRINGVKPTVAQKQQIYTDLFLTGKRVTRKSLLAHSTVQEIIGDDKNPVIEGIDGDFKASLSSLGKLRTVMKEDALKDSNQEMMEDIIFWGTVYGDDKRFIRTRIEEKYGDCLDERAIKQFLGMKFKDWGKLSREFLEMKSASEKEGSLIQALWETNDNLNTLMGKNHSFKAALGQMVEHVEKPLYEWTIDDLEGMYLSPSVKRMVWQTVKVLNEIVAVRGYAPSKIFVEMARDDAQTKVKNKGNRTKSRKDFLIECYKDDKEWKGEIASIDDADLRSKKLYLYYMQKGKCMYSGDDIDFAVLRSGEGYDIDHIHPQCYIKDDSLENNCVLVKRDENVKKGNKPVKKEICQNQRGFWRSLLKQGAITQEKFNRLTRSDRIFSEDFTVEELAGFINRQLVETRQGTKAVTQILQQAFPSEDTEIIFTKAAMASKFRQDFELVKVRCVNNVHHAHDAYLNIVVGDVYNKKFTKNPANYIKKEVETGHEYYNMNKLFLRDIKRGDTVFWKGPDPDDIKNETGSIAIVKAQLQRRTVLQTRRSYMAHGALSDATIYSKKDAKPESYRPVKSSDKRLADVTKYGGMTSIKNTAYALVEYTVKGKTIRSLEGVPIYLGSCSKDDEVLVLYLKESLQRENKNKPVENVSVRMYPIRQRSYLKVDGYYYYLGGATGSSVYLLDALTVYLEDEKTEYVKKVEKAVNKQRYDEITKEGEFVVTRERNVALYNYLVQKFSNGIFIKRKASVIETLVQGTAAFAALNVDQQCGIVMQILAWITTAQQNVNLTEIGGVAHAGTLLISKKLSNFEEALLIEQSVTGLWSKTTDLLTV